MKRLALLLLLTTGCLGPALVGASIGAHGPNPFAVARTAVAVATIATIVATAPPVVVDVGYDGRPRPGYFWVSGRQTWNGGAWVFTPGYWSPERSGYAYVNGRWEQRGDGRYYWVDGYWEASAQPYEPYEPYEQDDEDR